MSEAPRFEIDLKEFSRDPYPDLARMRKEAPVAFVPQLGATLMTRRDAIFETEKKIEIFSSDQPDGLMTRLMGQNMMRKDGASHQAERKAIFPSVSPRTFGMCGSRSFAPPRTEFCRTLNHVGRRIWLRIMPCPSRQRRSRRSRG